MINAGGILGQLTISATAWQQGLQQATQSLEQFAQTVERLSQQLDQRMTQTLAATGRVATGLNQATAAAQRHAPAIREAGEAHRVFGSYVNKATSDLGTFIQTSARWAVLSLSIGTAIGAIRSGFQGLGEATVGFNSTLQTSELRWTNLLGSMEAAQAFMGRIQQEAVRTPFDFEHLDAGIARLAAAGVAVRDLIDLNHDLGNALAFSGNQTNEAYDRGIKALANMQTSIRVNTREMNEFTRLGIPAWQILADHMGVTTGRLREMVEQGKINVNTFREAFHEWVTTDVGDLMTKQSRTFLTALSNIRDGLRFTLATAFRPVFERLNELANQAQDFAQSEGFQQWGRNVSAVMEVVMRAVTLLGGVFTTIFGQVLATVTTVGQAIYTALQWINPFARHSPSLVESVTEGVQAILERYRSLEQIGDTLTAIGARIEAFREAQGGIGAPKLDMQTRQVGEAFGPAVAATYTDAAGAIQEALALIPGLNREIADQKDVVKGAKDELDAYQGQLREIDDEIRVLEIDGRDYREGIESLKDQLLPARVALDAANSALTEQRDALKAAQDAVDPLRAAHEDLQNAVNRTRDALSAAKDELNGFIHAPIAGEASFQDKLNAINRQKAALDTQLAQLEARPGRTTDADKKALERLRDQERILAAQEHVLRAQREQETLPVRQARETAQRGPEMSPQEIMAGLSRVEPQVSGLERTLLSQVEAARAAKEALDAGSRLALAMEAALRPLELAQQARQRELSAIERQVTAAQNAYEQAILRPIERLREERHEVELTHTAIKERYDTERDRLNDLVSGTQAVKSAVREWEAALQGVRQEATTLLAEQKRAEREANAEAKANALNLPADPNRRNIDLAPDIETLRAQKAEFDAAVADLEVKTQGVREFFGRLQTFLEGPLGQALTSVITLFYGWRTAVFLLTPVLAALGTPFGALMVGMAALTEAWSRNLGEIQQITASFTGENGPFRKIGIAFEALATGDFPTFEAFMADGMAQLGTMIREALGYWTDNFLAWMGEVAPGFFQNLGDFGVTMIGWLVDQAEVIYQKLTQEWIPAFTDWLQQPETGAIARIGKLLVVLLGQIDTWTTEHRDDIENFFNRWTERLLAFIGHAVEVVGERLIEFILGIERWEETEGGKRMDDVGRRLGQAVAEGFAKGLARATYAFGNWIRGLAGQAPLPVPAEYGLVPPRPTAVIQPPEIPQEEREAAAARQQYQEERGPTHVEMDFDAYTRDLVRRSLPQATIQPYTMPPTTTAPAFSAADAARLQREWEEVSVRATQQHNPYALQVRFDASNQRIEPADADELLRRGKMPGKRTGGLAGGRTLVGEEGPEVVDLPAGSYVHPAGTPTPPPDFGSALFGGLSEKFKQMASFSSGPTVVVIDPASIVQIGEIVGEGVAAAQQTVAGATALSSEPPSYSTAGMRQATGDWSGGQNPWLAREAELLRMVRGGQAPEIKIENNIRAGMITDAKDIANTLGHVTAQSIRDSRRMGG